MWLLSGCSAAFLPNAPNVLNCLVCGLEIDQAAKKKGVWSLKIDWEWGQNAQISSLFLYKGFNQQRNLSCVSILDNILFVIDHPARHHVFIALHDIMFLYTARHRVCIHCTISCFHYTARIDLRLFDDLMNKSTGKHETVTNDQRQTISQPQINNQR